MGKPFVACSMLAVLFAVGLVTATAYSDESSATCGDPNGDGAVAASDALFVLDAAVGSRPCSLDICDVDVSGRITAKDALTVLKVAVGHPVSLLCETTSSTIRDECFEDDDCDPEFGQAGPHCCGYHCCECDGDDSHCEEGEHCENEVCVPDQVTTTSSVPPTTGDECFQDDDCDPSAGQGPFCCGYVCCGCDSDDQCAGNEHCEDGGCVPDP